MISAWLDKVLQLPPRTSTFTSDRNVAIRMRDGAVLLADIYRPITSDRVPTVLARSPYGRDKLTTLIAQIFAARGYNTIIQSCRGTFGSTGEFNPIFNERDDGLDTVDWIEAQPWYSGKLGLHGGSYLGMVQWAIAADLGPRLSAMAAAVTTSDFVEAMHEGGGFRLQDFLTWVRQVDDQERHSLALRVLKRLLFADPLKARYKELPLMTLDIKSVGHKIDFWREWAGRDGDDPFWKPIRFIDSIDRVKVPISMTAGWSDLFFRAQMRDYKLLRNAGATVRMTIGPWTHSSFALLGAGLRDALEWFDIHLRGKSPSDPNALDRLRYWVNGADTWCDTRSWPSARATPTCLTLCADGTLAATESTAGIRSFTYDPADPTPSVEGPTLTSAKGRGDMGVLCARKDVLMFDGPVIERDIEIAGDVTIELTTSANRPYHDLFVCLCDVDENGLAINITDGYRRLPPLSPEQQPRKTTLEASPIAWRVPQGHHLRLIVAGGAFPRFARNLGFAPSEGGGVSMRAVDINIHFDTDNTNNLIFYSEDVEPLVNTQKKGVPTKVQAII